MPRPEPVSIGKPGAVVYPDNLAGLGVCRGLGAHGIPVTVLSSDRIAPGQYSRYGRRVACPANPQDAEFIRFLIDVSRRQGSPPVLFLTDDASVMAVDQHRPALERWYRFPLAPWAVVKKLLLKDELYRSLEGVVPVPRTRVPADESELSDVAREIGFPAIVKPLLRCLSDALPAGPQALREGLRREGGPGPDVRGPGVGVSGGARPWLWCDRPGGDPGAGVLALLAWPLCHAGRAGPGHVHVPEARASPRGFRGRSDRESHTGARADSPRRAGGSPLRLLRPRRHRVQVGPARERLQAPRHQSPTVAVDQSPDRVRRESPVRRLSGRRRAPHRRLGVRSAGFPDLLGCRSEGCWSTSSGHCVSPGRREASCHCWGTPEGPRVGPLFSTDDLLFRMFLSPAYWWGSPCGPPWAASGTCARCGTTDT